jgi:hypothetical protein
MLTITYIQLTTMNAWKLATDVHHLDMRTKAPFTFDFAECHLVLQAPGSLISGGQCIHDAELLTKQVIECGIDVNTL